MQKHSGYSVSDFPIPRPASALLFSQGRHPRFFFPRMCFTSQVSSICLTRSARAGFLSGVYSLLLPPSTASSLKHLRRLRRGRQEQRPTTWQTRTTVDSWPRVAMKYGAGSSHERKARKEEEGAGNRRNADEEDFSSPRFCLTPRSTFRRALTRLVLHVARISSALGRLCRGFRASEVWCTRFCCY